MGDDFKSEHETALLGIIADSLSNFKSCAAYNAYNHGASVDQVIDMIANLRGIRNSSDAFGAVDESKLFEALKSLTSKGKFLSTSRSHDYTLTAV